MNLQLANKISSSKSSSVGRSYKPKTNKYHFTDTQLFTFIFFFFYYCYYLLGAKYFSLSIQQQLNEKNMFIFILNRTKTPLSVPHLCCTCLYIYIRLKKKKNIKITRKKTQNNLAQYYMKVQLITFFFFLIYITCTEKCIII